MNRKRHTIDKDEPSEESRRVCWCGHFACLHHIGRHDPLTICYADGCPCTQFEERP